jgi:predicted component of type VI protein secretion system
VLLRVYLGWRCQARLQLTLPVSLLPAAQLGKQRVQIGRTGILRLRFRARHRDCDGETWPLSGINATSSTM